MIEVKARVREWGRSLGIVLPKEAAKSEMIRKNDIVSLLINKRTDALKETFGTLKLGKTTDKILEESDEESWDE